MQFDLIDPKHQFRELHDPSVYSNPPVDSQTADLRRRINGAAGIVFTRSQPQLERPDVQIVFSAVANDAWFWFPGIMKPVVHSYSARVGTLYPKSRGWVKL